MQQLYQAWQSEVVDGRIHLNSFQVRGGAPASRSDIGRLQSLPVQSNEKDPTVSGAFGVVLKLAVSREGPSVDSPFTTEGSTSIPEKLTAEASIDKRRSSNGSNSEGGLFSDNSSAQYKIKPKEKVARRKEENEANSAKGRAPRQRTVSRETVPEGGGSEVVDNRKRVVSNVSRRGISRGLLSHNSPPLKNNATSVHQLAQRFCPEEENSDQVCSQRENERAVKEG